MNVVFFSKLISNYCSFENFKMILNGYYSREDSKFSQNIEHSRTNRICFESDVQSKITYDNLSSIARKENGIQPDQNKEKVQDVEGSNLDDILRRINTLHITDNHTTISSDVHPSIDCHPSLEQMSFIYVVSNHVYSEKNMYKIGKHKGTKKMLIKRYKTYLIEPIVYFFFPTGNPTQDETILLSRFSKFRLGTSEFVNLSIEKLLECIYFHFRMKYQRNPSVQIPYHCCIYNQELYDMFDKKIKRSYDIKNVSFKGIIQNRKCLFLPQIDFTDPMDCLRPSAFNEYLNHNKGKDQRGIESVSSDDTSRIDGNDTIVFRLDIQKLQNKMNLLTSHVLVNFMRSFMVSFDRMNYVLYLDQFLEDGLNHFFVQLMRKIYGYHSFIILNRREFLQKESFTERLILIRSATIQNRVSETDTTQNTRNMIEEPIEMVLEKIRFLNCCIVIEDNNIYSLENRNLSIDIHFKDLFYYFFYIL